MAKKLNMETKSEIRYEIVFLTEKNHIDHYHIMSWGDGELGDALNELERQRRDFNSRCVLKQTTKTINYIGTNICK